MTWMSQTFLRHKRISVKIMTLLRSLWCSNCHYIVRILSASISNPVRIQESNWKQLKEHLQKDYIRQNIKQQYYLRAYLEQYKQFFSKKDLCTYCLQYCVILSHLIAKQELNNYTVCLWFLKELLKKKQAKVVRQAEIKMSVSEYVFI
jgi:hypothetical protein